MELISTPAAPKPGGHYSQAVVSGNLIFVAGQLPLIVGTTPPQLPEGIEAQTKLALENAIAIVEAAGSSAAQVVNATLYITDVAFWPKVNEVFAAIFGEHRPARAMVTSPTLHFGALIEVQLIAERAAG